MSDLRFDERVVVVTGAGAGLGRTYALLFASRGAKVVVNDLGGGRDGDGKSSKAADKVVNEIKTRGGAAVADYNSVVEGEKIIKTALDNYGRIDILINNAGILRDRSFMKITDQDWDLIQAVHLKGSFKTTQAAFPIFKKQNYGRIIMTASTSGLYGNFGQANYSAAKMGLVGLANTVAIEGERYNIHCNIIVPTAASRLTQDIMPPELFEALKPDLIAPVVAYLCHESCLENGTIIESGGGWAGKCQILRANGAVLRKSLTENVSIENVQKLWEQIIDTKNGKCLGSGREVVMALAEVLEKLRDGNTENTQNEDEETDKFSFNNRDLIIYALGTGASVSKQEELKYLYENDADFSPLPLFFIQPALQAVMCSSRTTTAIPGKNIGLEQILHGEQYLEILDNLPTEGKLISSSKLVEVLDKGSGALLVSEVETSDEKGNPLVRNQIVAFAVGAGNFGGNRTGNKIIPCGVKPSRKPDLSLSQKTSVDQAALYRLSGDTNPLHIDPNIAVIGGYDRPILHGLCTLGFSVRLVLAGFANYDSRLLKAVKARFTKPVFPGQTLKVDMWQEGNRIHFETVIAETKTPVITGAYVDLKSIIKLKMPEKESSAPQLQSDAIFEFIIDRVKADPAKAKAINAIFLYNITKDGKQVKQWTMDLKNAQVYEGHPKEGKPNTTLTVADEDFMELAAGKLNPQAAFMKGKLKIAGNIMLAQKLTPLIKAEAKL